MAVPDQPARPRRRRRKARTLAGWHRRADGRVVGYWTDPLTGRQVHQRLTRQGIETDQDAELWAALKDQALRRDRLSLLTGSKAVALDVPVAKAVAAFIAAKEAVLAPKSVVAYNSILKRALRDWGLDAIGSTRNINGPALARMHTIVASLPISAPGRNHLLCGLRSAAQWWRKQGMVPASRDEIAEALADVPEKHHRREFLRPPEIVTLVEKVLGWRRAAGLFVLTSLLTGMRLGELLRFSPREHVEADDSRVHVPLSKTGRYRDLDLELIGEPDLVLPFFAGLPDEPWGPGGVKTLSRRVRHWAKLCRSGNAGPVPDWCPQSLRVTTETYLCAAAGAYRESRQLGHTQQEAERSYVGLAPRAVRQGMPLVDALGVRAIVERVR